MALLEQAVEQEIQQSEQNLTNAANMLTNTPQQQAAIEQEAMQVVQQPQVPMM